MPFICVQLLLIMKKILLASALFFVGFNGFSQQMTADYYLGVGERYLSKRMNDSAIYWWKYVIQNFPTKNKECSRSMFRIASAYERDSVGKAIRWYEKILADPKVNDMDFGMDILEPFANYRHNACLRLGAMNAKRRDYAEAIYWIRQAYTPYRYITYVGTAYEARMTSVATAMSDYYKQLGQKDSAVYTIVHKILDTDIKPHLPEYEPSKDNKTDLYGKFSISAGKIIEETYSKTAFKFELNKALKKLKVKKSKDNKWLIATFKLYKITYRIPLSDLTLKKPQVIERFKASPLFAELDK